MYPSVILKKRRGSILLIDGQIDRENIPQS